VAIKSEQSGKNDRIASTIRHNRARGKHTIDAMSEIVLELKNRNWKNARIARELGMRILPAMPKDYVPRFASMLGLSDKVQARAIRYLGKAKKIEASSGKGPTGVAAAALYIAAVLEGEKRTQREIAEVAHVTEVTVRNRYKELVKELNIKIEV